MFLYIRGQYVPVAFPNMSQGKLALCRTTPLGTANLSPGTNSRAKSPFFILLSRVNKVTYIFSINQAPGPSVKFLYKDLALKYSLVIFNATQTHRSCMFMTY